MINDAQVSIDIRTKRPGPALDATAETALDRVIRAGARSYSRIRDLRALIWIDGDPAAPDTAAGLQRIVGCLERALRAERRKARSGHWAYDLNRHIALRQAHVAETRRLAELQITSG